MKYKLFILGVGIWIVLLVLSVVFLRIWLYLILALPVTVLMFWDMFKKAWNEGYESYGQPRWTLRDEWKRQLRFTKVLLVLHVAFYAVLCWPLLLIMEFGRFRGKRVAQKEDKTENPHSNTTIFERFTDRAIKVEVIANNEARRLNHEYIGTEHLLLALVQKAGDVSRKIFNDFNITETNVRQETEKLVKSGLDIPTIDEGKLPQTPRAKNVIKYAVEEAQNLQRNNYVGTEHILLGLLRETDGVAYKVLTNLGVELNEVRKKVLEL